MTELTRSGYDALVQAIVEAIPAASRQPPAMAAPLAAALESTLLEPGATAAAIDQLCDHAAEARMAAVCVAPVWVARAASRLRSTPVLVVTTVGFPLGSSAGAVKVFEAAESVKLGADELDVVINLGALKSGDDTQVADELGAITALAHAAGARVKAILEMGLLTPDELERAAATALAAGVDFLKNGTGFGPGGATVEGMARLRELAAGRARVKAAGGIRTAGQARALLQAGADRLGTSAAAAILL